METGLKLCIPGIRVFLVNGVGFGFSFGLLGYPPEVVFCCYSIPSFWKVNNMVKMPLDSDNEINSHLVTDAVDPGKVNK